MTDPVDPSLRILLDPRRSLRARATLAVATGGLLLSVALTFTVRLQTRQRLENDLAAQFETLAAQVTDKIDRTLYERRRLDRKSTRLNSSHT